MRRLWFFLSVAAIGMVSGTSALGAQSSAAVPRITQPIDESTLTTLKGNVPFHARAEFDKGHAPSSTQLTHVRLVLSRSSEQQAALDRYLAELQDKSSPNYHKWLTPQEFGKLYGPAESDIAAIVAWLESHGLKVEEIPPGHTNIPFSGTVSQAEEAFHTPIHSFEAEGEKFLSNVVEPKIPTALANVVIGVAHLNTIEPRPHNVRGGTGKFDPDLRRMVPVSSTAAGPTPELTVGSTGNFSLYLVPGDAATIYDTPNSVFNANYTSGTSYSGQGVTIGIGGNAAILPATVADYRNRFLGNSTQPTITNVDGVTSTTNAGEAYIDTELSGGLAPGATVHFYTATDLFTAIQQAITDNTVDIFSLSFGFCELGLTTADNSSLNQLWMQASTQGIAVTVSTGDDGSAGCDDQNTALAAAFGLQVSGYASTPFDIAVGGTDFYPLLNSFTTYVSTTTSATNFYRTALSYIPESTWNDSTQVDTTISANVPTLDSSNNTNIVGGSGGVSDCSTNTTTNTTTGTCTHGYAKPTWQRGTGVPSDGARDLPDVSLFSGNGFDTAVWLICADDTQLVKGVTVTNNCTTQSDGQFYYDLFGGTSTAAPAFAGILALVEQKTGARLGQAAKDLYDLYNGPNSASIFHDVTVGNNSVVCTSTTPDCSKNAAGNFFLTGYDTKTGYDLATGMGSVDAVQLVKFWGTATGNGAATVTVAPASTTVPINQSLSVLVTVAGSGTLGTPTGTVTLAGGGYTSSAQALSSGTTTFVVAAGALSKGSDTLTATYSGDVNYATKTGTAAVTVTPLTATVAVTPATTTLSSTSSLTVTGTVTGSGATPTGTVILSGGGYTSAATAVSSGAYSITIPANSLAAGADTLTVTYSGDATYNTATGTALVTVTAPPVATVTVTPAATTVDTGQALSVATNVAGTAGTPTGTATLSGGGYTSSAQTLSGGSVTFNIPANSLSAGTDTLTVAYSGDATYTAASGATTVTVTQSVYSMSASTPTAVTAGNTASSTITVSSTTGYSGTVTLSCTLTSSPAGAIQLPTCSPAAGGSTVTLGGTTTSGTGSITVNTTGSTGQLVRPASGGWAGAGGGAVLALLLFLGIPARRRGWQSMLGVLVLLAALGAMAACSSNTKKNGTTSGSYTFTVTGSGSPAVASAPTTTFTLTVN